MNFDVEERKQQLDAFSAFINESYSQIDDMLQKVGWTRKFLTDENLEMVSCPLNPEHRVPKKSLDSHVQLCSWRQEGYHEQDTPLPENPIENIENTKSSIVIDAQLQAEIIKEMKEQDSSLQTGNLEAGIRLVPKTSDRLTADFTSDERRILYDFVISKTKPVEDVKVEELQLIGDMKRDEQPRPKSKLELLIEQRDAKRRRISYKKKVHTNRKTHTEILREVIQNQMDLVEQIIKGECDDEMVVDDDDNDETFSLGGDEVNISSQPKNENKSSHEVRKAAYVSDKERSSDKKVIKKDVGKYGSVPPENVERRYSRSEQSSESCLEKPDAYLKYEKYSSERRRHNEGHASSSFGEKAGRDRYYVNNNKGGERFRDYHYDRDNNHYPSRVNSEEVDDYRHYSKNSAKQDRSEFRKQYYSHSKHVKYSSKRDYYEVNSKDERETGSQTKRYKYSSKHSSSEHDWKHERKYEAIPEKSSSRSHKGDYTDKHSDHYDVHLQKFHREDKYDICKNGSVINDWSSEQKDVKFKVEDDEISPESKKYSKKVKKSKKKKKNRKHKTKKKHKRKKSYSSSNSSSQSSSEGSDSDSS